MSKTFKKNNKNKIDYVEDVYSSLRKQIAKPSIEHEDIRNKKKFKQKMKYYEIEE